MAIPSLPMCLSVLVLLLLRTDVHAQTTSVDWKFYGSADGPSHCFFDANEVKTVERHIRVWTKCLLEKDLEGIDIEKDFDGRILKTVAQKVVRSYIPPITLVEETIDFDKSMAITVHEETANIAPIEPQARIFYELDCGEHMIRELSISLVGGKSGSKDTPSIWHHVFPATNGDRLLKILCSQR